MTAKKSLSSASTVLSCKNNFLCVNYLIFKTQLIALLSFSNNPKISPHFKVTIKAYYSHSAKARKILEAGILHHHNHARH